jgi:nucleoside-diphosphate-sugar epimerase
VEDGAVLTNTARRAAPDDPPLRGRRVAVFGASGFIGARLVEKLVGEHGALVTAAVRNRRSARSLAALGARPMVANLRRPRAVEEAVSGCDVVINLAHDFRASQEENLSAFGNLAEACRGCRVERLVHTSSIVVYDDWPGGDLSELSPRERPGSEYKNAKLAMERRLADLARDGALRSVILQPTIVYGPRSWLWTDHMAERLLTGTVILPDRGEGLCHAVYVDDVADALVLAALVAEPGCERFIISGREPVTWRAYFEAIAEPLGVESIRYVEAGRLAGNQGGQPPPPPSSGVRGLARTAMNRALEVAGPAVVDRLKSMILARRRRNPTAVYSPEPHELELYLSRGRCRIDAARARLGYEPRFDHAEGSRVTAGYLVQKYVRGGRQ